MHHTHRESDKKYSMILLEKIVEDKVGYSWRMEYRINQDTPREWNTS